MSEGTTAPVAPKNNTGTIALVVAGILLFVVCAMAYKDYVDSAADRDRSQWAGQPGQPNPNVGYQNPANNVNGNYNNQPGQQRYDQFGRPIQPNGYPNNQANIGNGGNFQNNGNPGQPAYPATTGGQPVGTVQPTTNVAVATTPPNGEPTIFDTAPPAPAPNAEKDPNSNLEIRRRELEQQRIERQIVENQMRDLNNGGTGNTTGVQTGVAGADSVISGPIPGIPSIPTTSGAPIASPQIAPTGVAGQKPAFTPELIGDLNPEWKEKVGPELFEKLKQDEASLRAAERRIKNTPAIATVKMYDSQWNFVEIDGGKDRNLRMNQRLTVRRGARILGVVEITELGDNYAVAELKSANAKRDDTIKPQAGDELIPAELF